MSGRTEVRLRPVRDEDLAVLFAQQLEPEATAMAGFPARDEEAFSAHWARLRADDTIVNAVVEVDGAVAGSIGSWVEDGRRYVGYWYGRGFWGRGLATEALLAFVETVEDRPLYAHAALHNLASMRVLQKVGFTEVVRDDDEVLFELT